MSAYHRHSSKSAANKAAADNNVVYFKRFIDETRQSSEKLNEALQQATTRLNTLVTTFTSTIASLSAHYNTELSRLGTHIDLINMTLQAEVAHVRARALKVNGNLGHVDVGSLDAGTTLLGQVATQQDFTVHGIISVHNDTTNEKPFTVDTDGHLCTTSVTVTTPIVVSNGGTGQTTYELGDILFGSSTNTLSRLAGTTSDKQRMYLSQRGTGSTSAAPEWIAIDGQDIQGSIYATALRHGSEWTTMFGGPAPVENQVLTFIGNLAVWATPSTTTGSPETTTLGGDVTGPFGATQVNYLGNGTIPVSSLVTLNEWGDLDLNGGIQLPTTSGTKTTLNYYEEGVFSTAFSGAHTTDIIAIRIVRIGNRVSLYMPVNGIQAASASANLSATVPLPMKWRPSAWVHCVIFGQNAGADTILQATADNTGLFRIAPYQTPQVFSSSGQCGWFEFEMSWMVA